MNLEQTIAELEKKAQQYTEAANTLRALEAGGAEESPAASLSAAVSAPAASSASTGSKSAASGRKAAAKSSSSKQGKTGQKRYVSPETRAKITAALKASHAARKAAAAAA